MKKGTKVLVTSSRGEVVLKNVGGVVAKFGKGETAGVIWVRIQSGVWKGYVLGFSRRELKLAEGR